MKHLSTLMAALFALPLSACVINDADDDDGDASASDPTGTEGTNATTGPSTSSPSTTSPETTDPDTSAGGEDPGTSDTTPGGGVCQHTCSADEDCLAAGLDIGLICTDSQCLPAEPPDLCESDEECIPLFSGWVTPCTMGGGECAATMQVCIDLGDGTGACATAPSEFVTCDLLMQAEVEQTNLDDGMPVTVCANTSATCHEEGYCYVPCVDDTTCGALVCNVDTGVCECDSDDDCGEGTCDAGVCTVPGCTSDEECVNPFDGGTIACN